MVPLNTHDPLAAVARNASHAVGSQDYGSALDIVRGGVNDVICNPRSMDVVLSSRELDSVCEAAAAAVRAGRQHDGVERRGTVVLVTELVRAGGHIELIKDYLRLGVFQAPVTLVATDVLGRADPALNSDFATTHGIGVLSAEGADTGERLLWLLDCLERLSPNTLVTVLYNHDSLGIAAALASDAAQRLFVHVGDHQLSLGVTCPQFTHVDLTAAVHQRCRHHDGLSGNVYWPLTVKVHDLPRPSNFKSEGTLTTCCSGRYAKFVTLPYKFTYTRMIPVLLGASGGQHIHIGEFPPDAIEAVRRDLIQNDINPDRFSVIPYVPSLARALLDHHVDLYVSSFPLGGGKAVIEAMAAGIPLLMHRSYRSPVIDSIDLVYPEALAWGTQAEFETCLRSCTQEELLAQSKASRLHFETFYGDAKLLDAVRGLPSVPMQSVRSFFQQDATQVFWDNEATIEGIATRLKELDTEHIMLHEEYEHILDAYKTLSAQHSSLSDHYSTLSQRHELIAAQFGETVKKVDYDQLKRGYDDVLAGYNSLVARLTVSGK